MCWQEPIAAYRWVFIHASQAAFHEVSMGCGTLAGCKCAPNYGCARVCPSRISHPSSCTFWAPGSRKGGAGCWRYCPTSPRRPPWPFGSTEVPSSLSHYPIEVNDKNSIPTGWFVYLFLSKHQTWFSSLGQILFPCPPSSLCFKSLHHLLSFSLWLLWFLLFHHL